jgi:hypothetical protein
MPFQTLAMNLRTDRRVRTEKLEGRDHTVIPMAMLTEGVHPGSQGPILYELKELKKNPLAWNHMPIIVYHPKNGKSARDPLTLNDRKVGLVLNSGCDSKLRAEAWIDNERAKQVDPVVDKMIRRKKKMEVSTGLFLDLVGGPGIYKNESYIGKATNLQPDHLALLPEGVGACSIEKGAGLFQMNSLDTQLLLNHRKSMEKGLLTTILNQGNLEALQNELGHSDVLNAISKALEEELGDDAEDIVIQDIAENEFVYWENGTLMRQSYEISDSGVSLVEPAEKVSRTILYAPLGSGKGNTMAKAKKATLDALIANESTQYEESDREWLKKLNEEHLQRMIPVANDDEEADDSEEEEADEEEEVETEVKTKVKTKSKAKDADDEEEEVEEQPKKEKAIANGKQKPLTKKEWLALCPPEIAGVMNESIELRKQERSKLISQIKSDPRCTFNDEFLKAQTIPNLQALAALVVNEDETDDDEDEVDEPVTLSRNPFSYKGQATPATNSRKGKEEKEEPLLMPSLDAVFNQRNNKGKKKVEEEDDE